MILTGELSSLNWTVPLDNHEHICRYSREYDDHSRLIDKLIQTLPETGIDKDGTRYFKVNYITKNEIMPNTFEAFSVPWNVFDRLGRPLKLRVTYKVPDSEPL